MTTTVRVTKTPIAWWVPSTKKGGRLTLFRVESTRSGMSYSYQGNGSSGGVKASNDEEAIAHVERAIVPMQSGKLKREV